MALKHKRCDAGNSNVPKKSHKELPLSEKVYVYHKCVCIGKNTVYSYIVQDYEVSGINRGVLEHIPHRYEGTTVLKC